MLKHLVRPSVVGLAIDSGERWVEGLGDSLEAVGYPLARRAVGVPTVTFRLRLQRCFLERVPQYPRYPLKFGLYQG